jgi:hypothetical protein
VWFLQDGSVSCNEGGTGNGNPFGGDHTDGDILLVAAFTNGGTNPTISAYQWQGGANGSLDPTAIVTGSLCGQSTDPAICAITNQSGPISLPWNTQDKNASTTKNKTGLGTSLSADQFYEGAVDLTAKHLDVDSNGDPICVNKFVFDTRSAQSLTATLYDYAIGNVHTCASPTVSTSLRRMIGSTPAPTTDTVLTAASHTVAAGSKVYDTSTLSGALGTPTGTVTYSLWTDSACSVAATSPLFTNTGGGTSNTSDALSLNANGTLPNSPVLTFSSPGNYYWQATYSGGGRNSGATSTCSTEPLTVQAPPPMATTILLSDKVQVEAIGSGPTPTGSVSFTLYPSADCTGTALYGPTSAVSLVNGVATTPVATAVAAGTYSWKVTYTPDATATSNNYSSSSTTCTAAQSDEKAVISYAGNSPIPTS